METRHIENTSVKHFEEMNSNGIFQSDGNSNFVKFQSPISLTANKEIIYPLMEQHSDHYNNAVLSSDDMQISSFDLERHVSVELTQSKEDEKNQEIVCLNGIDEDGDNEVLASEDMKFEDEDNEVDMMVYQFGE